MCYSLTGTQPDVVQYSEPLSIDQLWRRHSCSPSSDILKDFEAETMSRRRTYYTTRHQLCYDRMFVWANVAVQDDLRPMKNINAA